MIVGVGFLGLVAIILSPELIIRFFWVFRKKKRPSIIGANLRFRCEKWGDFGVVKSCKWLCGKRLKKFYFCRYSSVTPRRNDRLFAGCVKMGKMGGV